MGTIEPRREQGWVDEGSFWHFQLGEIRTSVIRYPRVTCQENRNRKDPLIEKEARRRENRRMEEIRGKNEGDGTDGSTNASSWYGVGIGKIQLNVGS